MGRSAPRFGYLLSVPRVPLSPEGQEGHPGQERGVHTESLVVGEGIVEEQTDFHLGAG